jgi:hypothetical protein
MINPHPIYNKESNTVSIGKGWGYWNLSRFPWGGEFHRMQNDSMNLPVIRILKYYNDKTPGWIVADYNGVEIGITL